jgi:leucyl/phenylalanyl-tRNA---protein transferase
MGEPGTGDVHWYNPDPRAVLPLDQFHVSRSLLKTLRRARFRVSFDMAFDDVMKGCAARPETWITNPFFKAYGDLHKLGYAHSIEIWHSGLLAGGLYGVGIRGAFFGESMFYRVTDASKVALYALVERLKEKGFLLLEVQFLTPHLKSLGAVEIEGRRYRQLLDSALEREVEF